MRTIPGADTTRKSRILKTIFAFVFFTSFLAPFSKTVFATTDYRDFITLFANPLDDEPSNAEIISGAKSGLKYSKPLDFANNNTAIKSIQFIVSLNSMLQSSPNGPKNPAKDRAEYIYDHIARQSLTADMPGYSVIATIFPAALLPSLLQTVDTDAFMIRVFFKTSQGETREYLATVPNKQQALSLITLQPGVSNTKRELVLDYGTTTVVDQQVITADVSFDTPVTMVSNAASWTAELWYCGGKTDSIDGTAPTKKDIEGLGNGAYLNWVTNYKDQGNKTFKNQCDGTAYYKIGETTFKPPSSYADAQTQISEAATTESQLGIKKTSAAETLPSCGIVSGSLTGCIAQIVYYFIFLPISFIAGLLGNLFDFFLGYSLSDQSYRHDFIQSSWQLVRDISNIFFIILMIWSGLAVVFGIGKVSYKQVVPALIINALLINFSLFATRVVVDVSNITARLFYNQMTVKVDGQIRDIGISGFKPISESIVSAFNPQRIFENASVLSGEVIGSDEAKDENLNTKAVFNGGQNINDMDTSKLKRGSNEYASYFLLVTIMAALIMWGVAMMFWKTAFIFVGRVIGIYVSMIFSPFAFLTRGNIPLLGSLPISWSKWWGELTNYAVVAPIFLFFLYIINAFLGVKFFSELGIAEADGLFGTIMYILIPMLIIYGLMTKAAGIAKQYAGDMGNMVQGAVQGIAGKAIGLAGGAALGLATGGVALAGRGIAARYALSAETRAALEAKKAAGGFSGRFASLRLGADKKLQTSSFDARNTGAFKGMSNAFGKEGIKFSDPLSGKFGMGTDDTKGGVKAAQKREKEALKKQIDAINVDASVKEKKVKEIWEKKSAVLAKKEEARLSKASIEELAQAHKDAGKSDEEIELMKTNNTLKENLAELAKSKVASDYGDVTNNKQLTRALRQEFAQTISEGKTFGQQMAPLNIAAGVLGTSGLVAAAGTGVLPVVGGVALDANRAASEKREGAKKYFDDAKKNKRKLPKQERLEKEKKEIETELEEMDGYVESIQDTLKKHFQTIIDEANAGNEDFKKFKNRTVDSFGTKPEDEREAMIMHKDDLQADFESKDMEIKRINAEHQKAIKDGRTADAERLGQEKKKASIEKSRTKRSLDNLDESKRARKERDLASKESELDKIKDKEENKDKSKEGTK